MPEPETLLTRKQAAEYLRKQKCSVSYETLANFAANGEGPNFYKDGARAMYDPEDLDQWRRKRLQRKVMA